MYNSIRNIFLVCLSIYFGCVGKIVGTDLGEQAVRLADCPRDSPTVIVLGNEGASYSILYTIYVPLMYIYYWPCLYVGHGVRTNILRRCSKLVKIGSSGEEKT